MPVKVQSFEQFHKALRGWEEEYGVKLLLGPGDYRIEKRPTEPKPIRRGEKIELDIVAPGRLKGEMLGVARGRAIATLTRKRVGERARVEVVWNKHDLYVAREMGVKRRTVQDGGE